MATKTEPSIDWQAYIPTRQRTPGAAPRRHLVSIPEDELARLSEHAHRLHLTNPAMITTLLNIADAIEAGEL